MGRRLRKRAETYDGSSWPETSDEMFVYDGWNVVMILNANEQNEVMREYTWGLDLSGTIHGAGGIGGLLADYHPTGGHRYWYFYDANGNVGQVLDATNTNNITLAAHYEYDPYGNAIVADDVDGWGTVNLSPFRFSTKWFDDETGLYYYGYRYYSPRLGRWMSRDPMGEEGGPNLYGFVRNAAVSSLDLVGLAPIQQGSNTWCFQASCPEPPLPFGQTNTYAYGPDNEANGAPEWLYTFYVYRWWIAPPSPNDVLQIRGDILDDIRGQSEVLAFRGQVVSQLKLDARQILRRLQCDQRTTFTDCGSRQVYSDLGSTNVLLGFQQFTVYWKANCGVGPKKCNVYDADCPSTNNCASRAFYSCDVSWTIYDRFDFEWWEPYGWPGTPFHIVGDWSDTDSGTVSDCEYTRPKAGG